MTAEFASIISVDNSFIKLDRESAADDSFRALAEKPDIMSASSRASVIEGKGPESSKRNVPA